MVNVYLWILVMAGTTWLMRVLPVTVLHKPIENKFVQSFLYYVPYITLAVMTFPAMVEATQSPLAGWLAMVAGIVIAYFSGNLFITAAACSFVVLVAELIVL